MTTREPSRGLAESTGLALTFVGGGLAALSLIPIALVTWFAVELAMAGITEDAGLFVCRDQACVDEAVTWALAGLGVVLTVVLLIVLAAWSRAWSMVLVAAIGTGAFTLLAWFALTARAGGAYDEVVAALLAVAAAPGCLALGSVLRLWARREA
jgi:hypothetical protein